MTRWTVLALAALLLLFTATAVVRVRTYDALPDRVPTHWNWENQPDRWTAKTDLLGSFFAVPLVALGLWSAGQLLRLVSELRPAWSSMDYTLFIVVVMFGAMQAILLTALIGGGPPSVTAFVATAYLAMALMGLALRGLPPNGVIGVRTPWTLGSERVWHATHQFAGRWSIPAGILGAVGAVAGAPLVVLAVGMLVWGMVPVGYSWWIARRFHMGDGRWRSTAAE